MAALLEAADHTADLLLQERHAIGELRTELDQREETIEHQLLLLDEIRKLAAQLDGARDASSNGGGAAPDPEAGSLTGRNGGRAPDDISSSSSGSAPSGRGGTTSNAKPAAPRPPATARTPPSGSKRDAVLEHIENMGEVKAADVCRELNLSAGAASQHLRALVGAGAIKARGATSTRVYLSTTRALELDAAKIDAAKIDREPKAPPATTKPKASAPAALRPKVTDLIARNPGQLTAPLIAQGIPADETDVALVVNQLLDDGAIERTTNGAFRTKLEDPWS